MTNKPKYGTLLVSIQDLVKGQTLDILNVEGIIANVKPNGYSKTYSVPYKYIKLPNEDLEYPRCQEIYQLWNCGNA